MILDKNKNWLVNSSTEKYFVKISTFWNNGNWDFSLFFILKMKNFLTIENMKLKKVAKNLHFRKKWI